MDDSTRFKADPYNPKNRALTHIDLQQIFNSLEMSVPVSDISLYQKAYIHKSYTHLADYDDYQCPDNCLPLYDISYETMEFLGDALLGSIVSAYLYERYVCNFQVDEGFLTKLKIRLVCGDQLGYLSNQLGFSTFMIISKHIDDNCDGRQNIHILEDIFEAFLGALYLDTHNLEYVKEFIIKTIETHVDMVDLIAKDNNYKDQILRYFQHNFKVHPVYATDKLEDMDIFECKIYKQDECIECGRGSTKKKAEQEASRKALQKYFIVD
jgi:ribonuclease III